MRLPGAPAVLAGGGVQGQPQGPGERRLGRAGQCHEGRGVEASRRSEAQDQVLQEEQLDRTGILLT